MWFYVLLCRGGISLNLTYIYLQFRENLRTGSHGVVGCRPSQELALDGAHTRPHTANRRDQNCLKYKQSKSSVPSLSQGRSWCAAVLPVKSTVNETAISVGRLAKSWIKSKGNPIGLKQNILLFFTTTWDRVDKLVADDRVSLNLLRELHQVALKRHENLKSRPSVLESFLYQISHISHSTEPTRHNVLKLYAR